jgi:hypothetical protein
MKPLVAMLLIALTISVRSAHAQSSLCTSWKSLMAHREDNFVAITGPLLRNDGLQTLYQSAFPIGKDWDEVVIRTYSEYRSRHFEAKKKGFTDQNSAYNWLNDQLARLSACLPGYAIYRFPSTVDKYYIASTTTGEDHHAMATIGYSKGEKGAYEGWLFIERFYEVVPDEAILADIKPLAVIKPIPGPNAYVIGDSTVNKQAFAQKLQHLISLSKTSFNTIRGTEVSNAMFRTFYTPFRLDGADSQSLALLPSGMVYNAIFATNIFENEGKIVYDQLLKLVSDSLPIGFTNKGGASDEFGRKAQFVFAAEKQVVTVESGGLANDIRLTVSQPKFIPN